MPSYEKKYFELLEKYQVLGATCDDLWKRIQVLEDTFKKGKELVDQLMTVIEINKQLQEENDRLTALVEGLEPPPDLGIKA